MRVLGQRPAAAASERRIIMGKPLSLHHQERELDLAVSIARWCKLLNVQFPVENWAQIAVSEYARIAKSASNADLAALLAALKATISTWAGGDGKALFDALSELLNNASVSNADFGGQIALRQLGIAGSFTLSNPAVLEVLQTATENIRAKIDTTTQDQIGKALVTGASAGLDIDATARLVKTMVGESWPDLSKGRARTIATTEVCRATSFASQQTYSRNGIERKEWETSQDEKTCDPCAALNGEVVAVGASFSSGDQHPPLHPTCRCTLLPVIPEHWTAPLQPWTGA